MSKENFIKQIAPLVQSCQSEFFNSVTIAQAIHETGWGKSELAVKANNLFGIKASAPWKGATYNVNTGEEAKDGTKYRTNADFRKYSSWEESIKDHANFLVSTEQRKVIYQRAISAPTAKVQAEALTGTYATDSSYGRKLIEYMDAYNLYQYDQKESGSMKFEKPKMLDRRKQALGYPSHGAYARRSKSAIKTIVWHYTATERQGRAQDVIKAHESHWRNRYGWDIGGYHFYIGKAGDIVQNYDLETVSYGAGRLNPQLVHICCEGSTSVSYTKAQVKAREELTLWLMQELNIPASQVKGHKEIPYNDTPCPGYSVAELNKIRADLASKFKQGGNPNVNAHNPQGLKEFKPTAYKEPRLPFADLKVGDKVTLAENWSWYNPTTKNLIKSNRYEELVGATDEIVEIMEIDPMNHSKYAYRLKQYNSWLPQEYAVEAKRDWELVPEKEDEVTHSLQEGEYLDKDGVVWVWKKK